MKLKLFSLCLFLTAVITLYSQDKKFKVGLAFSPDYCYRTLSNHSGNPGFNSAIDAINSIDVFKLGFTAGFSLEYPVFKSVSIGTGLFYSDKGFQTKELPVTTFSQPDGAGFAHMVYHYQYAEVPLMVYKIFNFGSKNALRIGAGIGNSIYIGNYTKSFIRQGNMYTQKSRYSEDSAHFNHYVPSIITSLGYERNINDNWSWKIEPTFRHSLKSMVDEPFHYVLYSFGVNLGLSVKW